MTELPSHFDALGLRASGADLRARIGGIDLGPALLNANMHTALNELPTAALTLDRVLLAGQPVDYFGSVELSARGAGAGGTFNGNVVTASPSSGGLELACQTHPSLTESRLGGLESHNCDGRELMYLVTRTGGL